MILFYLSFLSDTWCWESLHMLLCHRYIFFGEIFGKNFLNWVVYFLVELIFLLFVYFDTNYLSDISEIYGLCWNSKDFVHEYFWALYCVALYLLVYPWVLYSIIKSFGNITLSWLMQLYQIRSVAQSCPTLCYPMNCSTPGLPVHHVKFMEFQTSVCLFFSILCWLFWIFHCCINFTISLLISTN